MKTANQLLKEQEFNPDGSMMNKRQARFKKKIRVGKIDVLLANGNTAMKLFLKRQTQNDAAGW